MKLSARSSKKPAAAKLFPVNSARSVLTPDNVRPQQDVITKDVIKYPREYMSNTFLGTINLAITHGFGALRDKEGCLLGALLRS